MGPAASVRTTCHRKQQNLVIRNRPLGPILAFVSVVSTVRVAPHYPLSGGQSHPYYRRLSRLVQASSTATWQTAPAQKQRAPVSQKRPVASRAEGRLALQRREGAGGHALREAVEHALVRRHAHHLALRLRHKLRRDLAARTTQRREPAAYCARPPARPRERGRAATYPEQGRAYHPQRSGGKHVDHTSRSAHHKVERLRMHGAREAPHAAREGRGAL